MPVQHKILVTGASGFIGKAVCDHFKKLGYPVFRLVRHAHEKQTDTIFWNPVKEEIPLDALEGFYAVIHLAGENIAKRWTKDKKEAIFLSRVRHTWLLSHALSRLKRPPKVFFSASAIGYYGDRGDELLTENHHRGKGFLPDVCAKWEAATKILEQSKVRVVRGRFGAVLSLDGGMLAKMVPIFRLCLGGRVGDGRQWISWIAKEDLVRAIQFVIENDKMQGTYNFTAPHPLTNREFTKRVAKLVHRPAFLPLPAWIVKLLLGQMGQEVLLSSARAVPKRLLEVGFVFSSPEF